MRYGLQPGSEESAMGGIDEVVSALDRIIAVERERGSRRGYFPCMYRATTLRVARGLAQGRFEDPDRMARLDVVFARYYLEAWRRDGVGERCSGAWRHAFRAARDPSLLIVQHLLLGMNAHIHLDLAQATVEVAGDELDALRADFDTINDILGEQLDEVQAALNQHSRAMARLDEAGGRWDEGAFHFSLCRARDFTWAQARLVAALPAGARPAACRALDTQACATARLIRSAQLPAARAVEPDTDRAGVRAVIDALWALG